MSFARSRLFSVVLLVPILLAWFEGKGPYPLPSPVPVAPGNTPSAAPAPAAPGQASPVPIAPQSPEPSAPAPTPVPPTPVPPTPVPSAPPAPVSPPPPATPVAPRPGAPASPAPAASPASGRKPSNTPGMATLEGHALEDVEGKLSPVNKTEVMIPELNLETFTKPNGRFTIKHIPVREKPYEIMIIHPGFENSYEKRTFDKEERFKSDFTIKRKGF